MVKNNIRVINVGYFGYNTKSWLGGVNYLRNILIALHQTGSIEVKPYVFLKKNHDPEVRKLFEPLATCIILDLNKPIPFFLKALDKLLSRRTDFFTRYYLSKYNIKVIAQSDIDISRLRRKSIGWIPDFQHLQYPELFSESELKNRAVKHKKLVTESSAIIVSSEDAARDLVKNFPGVEGKTHVLHFVSQIDQRIYSINADYRNTIEKKYNFSGKFFFLPNKFWKHKNHIVVFKAVQKLKYEGIDILLICTGEMAAWESETYIEEICDYIESNNLKFNIRVLGIVDYFDVQYFLRHSISVINPSLFEGWSSTVEECKSLGKNIILSDIPVHREQNPTGGIYFNPGNAEELSEILKTKWIQSEGGPDFDLEKDARKNISKRIQEFGEDYVQIINSVL